MIELALHQRTAAEQILILLDRFGGAILADEVGLGKSFVAAEVARRLPRWEIEAIVPASLVAQWRGTLAEFGVDARILTHDSLAGDPFAPRPERRRLLLVDEAHGFRNPVTQRYAALARRSIGARLLLITATPICNAPADLMALISLIAADDALRPRGVASIEEAFRGRDAAAIRVVLGELVVRRGRDVLPEALRFGSIERRVIRHSVLDAAGIDALRFPLIGDGGQRQLLRRLLWRRLESSEAALLESIRRQQRFYERALDCIRTGRVLRKREYRRAFGDEDARDAFQGVLFWDVFAPNESHMDAEELLAEIRCLDALRDQAAAAPSTKQALLLEVCRAIREPILIFTAAVATACDIVAAMPGAGLLTSRMERPSAAADAFRRGTIDVLVCTDLAAEGLNLQRAGAVVHYDIPWNPMKLEQRNGRAWRIGQARKFVLAIYFLPRHRRTRIVQAMTLKNRERRRLLDRPPVTGSSNSVLALPPRLTRDAPAVALIRHLESSGIPAPPQLGRRYRAGIERLFAEMAHEFIDRRRLEDLLALLREERGTPV